MSSQDGVVSLVTSYCRPMLTIVFEDLFDHYHLVIDLFQTDFPHGLRLESQPVCAHIAPSQLIGRTRATLRLALSGMINSSLNGI